MSIYGAALIEEGQERGLAERIRQIAAYNYRDLCSYNSLWYQVSDIHMLALGSVDTERDYRLIAQQQKDVVP